MNLNLFARDLQRNLRKFLIWTISIIALNVFTAAMYDSIAGSTQSLQLFLKMYPEALMKAFGMDATSWSNVLGFYATYFVFYILLSGGIFAITFGMDILGTEESKRTAEFLYTRPLTRTEIYISKAATAVTDLLLFNLANYLCAWITLTVIAPEGFSFRNLTILHTYGMLFCFMFCGIGLLVASLIKRGKSSLFAGIGVVMLMYFYDALVKTTKNYDSLGYLTPYRFVPLNAASDSYGFTAGSLVYFLAIAVGSLVAGLLFFRKKDIYV